MDNNLLIHIPHSSMNIPEKYTNFFSANSETIKRNLIKLTDFSTDDLFNHPKHQNRLIFPVSRLLCDVERYLNDEDEIMSKIGMGVVYTKGAYGEMLRPSNEDLRTEIINKYYKSHHEKLFEEVMNIVNEYGQCIIVDAHSFPSKPLPYELNQNEDRADFCVGTDPIHTPVSLVKNICDCITKMGYSVELNKPYSGTIVPLKLYSSDVPVISVMIEVNRRLYMDEINQSISSSYDITKKAIHEIIDIIDGWRLEK